MFLDYATLGIGSLSPLVLVGLTIYGFFNMDFLVYVLPPFCISEKISTLTVISMDYTVALFPLFLSAVLYLLVALKSTTVGASCFGGYGVHFMNTSFVQYYISPLSLSIRISCDSYLNSFHYSTISLDLSPSVQYFQLV
jgi:hypothetical protein